MVLTCVTFWICCTLLYSAEIIVHFSKVGHTSDIISRFDLAFDCPDNKTVCFSNVWLCWSYDRFLSLTLFPSFLTACGRHFTRWVVLSWPRSLSSFNTFSVVYVSFSSFQRNSIHDCIQSIYPIFVPSA